MGLRPTDPDTVSTRNDASAYGAEKAEEICSRDVHHILVYRVCRSNRLFSNCARSGRLDRTKTLTELWHFRLKGAPEPIYRRALAYYNLINSPSTLVNADDLINFWRCQRDWRATRRTSGSKLSSQCWPRPNVERNAKSANGLSEMPMREMFRAWSEYMAEGAENVG